MRTQILAISALLTLGMSTSALADGSMSSMSMKAAAATPVAISNFKFTPAELTVAVGTTVTWTNQGPAPHTTTSLATPAVWDSGPMPRGRTYSFTFKSAGVYKYHCSIHPSMLGTVTVRPVKK